MVEAKGEALLKQKGEIGASWDTPANAMHHLCGSVGSMSGLLDMLKNKKGDAEFTDQFIHLMDRAVQNSMAVVHEFMVLLRPLQLKKQTLNLEDWLRGTAARHAVSRTPGIAVRWRIDSGSLPPMAADPELLARAVNAILDNALEAMPDGGTLTLGACGDPAKERAHLTVQDTGVGMEDYILESACGAFYTMKNGHKGTGLSWAQKIAAAHGGTLELSSAPRAGTSVLLKLPAEKKRD